MHMAGQPPTLALALAVVLLVGPGARANDAALPPGPSARARPPAQRHNALERVNVGATRPDPDPTVRLSVSSTKLKRSGQWFTVEWANVPNPDWGDWVALLPAYADPIWSATPFKYDIAGKTPSHIRRGSGKLRRARGAARRALACVAATVGPSRSPPTQLLMRVPGHHSRGPPPKYVSANFVEAC
jgi:hypothetical protein